MWQKWRASEGAASEREREWEGIGGREMEWEWVRGSGMEWEGVEGSEREWEGVGGREREWDGVRESGREWEGGRKSGRECIRLHCRPGFLLDLCWAPVFLWYRYTLEPISFEFPSLGTKIKQNKATPANPPTKTNKQAKPKKLTTVNMVDGAAGPSMKSSDVTHSQLFSGTSCPQTCCPGLTQCFYKGLLAHPWEIFLCCALIEKLHGKYSKLKD